MSTAIRLEVRPDFFAILTIDQAGSKVNVLNQALWQELRSAVVSLASQSNVKGLVVISAKPGIFIAGADLRELLAPPLGELAPTQATVELGLDVLAHLANLPFPTAAVIDGAALGGGLEVALACDSRLCGTNPKIALGLPETSLGLIPGWGGTQRLPRLIGCDAAAKMITSAQPIRSDEALNLGLVDAIHSSDELIEAACRHLGSASDWTSRRAARSAALSAWPAAPALRAAQLLAAPADLGERWAGVVAVDVIASGASRPLSEALAIETAAFVPLVHSQAARHAVAEFFAKREARKVNT